ncbi:MAG: diphthamide synthesis protein [Nanoarchaeota archaeon]
MKIYYLLYKKNVPFKVPPFFKRELTILYSFPYIKIAEKIADWFKKRGAKVKLHNLLGCEALKADILVSESNFYLDASLIKNNYIWLFDGEWKKIKVKEKPRERGHLIEYYDNIGIIISLKPGQNNLYLAEKLKKILEKKGKNIYLFLFDNVENLEDFNFIELWINTACPRIKGKKIIQAYEVFNYLKTVGELENKEK